MYKKLPSRLCTIIDKYCCMNGYSLDQEILQNYFEEAECVKKAFEILGVGERNGNELPFLKLLDWITSECEYIYSTKKYNGPNNIWKFDFDNKSREIPWFGVDFFSLIINVNDQDSLDSVYEVYVNNKEIFSEFENGFIKQKDNRQWGVNYVTQGSELHYFSQNYMYEMEQRFIPIGKKEEIDFYFDNDPTLELIRMIDKAETLEDIEKLKNNNVEKRKAAFIVCRFMNGAFSHVEARAEALLRNDGKSLLELGCFKKDDSIPVVEFSVNPKEKDLKDFFKK